MRKSPSKLKTVRENPQGKTLSVPPAAEVKAPLPKTDTKGGIKKAAPRVLNVTTRSLDDLLDNLLTITGTRCSGVAARIAGQVADSLHFPTLTTGDDAGLIAAIGMIAELEPQNFTEAMLAAQMIATHEKALVFLRSATGANQTFDGQEAAMNFGIRLMRLSLEQLEAMQKLKGKAGQQKVVVEHVHVHVNEGGQAIVGAVNAPKEEGGGGQ